MSIRRTARRAYTAVELLIVTAIIGILIALLLPAVQAAREAARRSMCSKNLEQLIIAVHNYEMHHGVYPPGTVNDKGPIQSLPIGYHHNWIIQLLPYIEQNITSNRIDRQVGVYDAANMPVRQQRLRLLLCSSYPNRGTGYSNYAGVHNDFEMPIDVNNNGVFFLNSRMRVADVKDGTSETLFIGEKQTIAGDLGWMSGTRATLRNTGVALRQRFVASAPEGFPPGVEDPVNADSSFTDMESFESLYGTEGNLFQPDPNPMARTEPSAAGAMAMPDNIRSAPRRIRPPKDVSLAVGGFGSMHPGGAQFAVGDGSVRFISETIDPRTYVQLGNRADNQLIQVDW